MFITHLSIYICYLYIYFYLSAIYLFIFISNYLSFIISIYLFFYHQPPWTFNILKYDKLYILLLNKGQICVVPLILYTTEDIFFCILSKYAIFQVIVLIFVLSIPPHFSFVLFSTSETSWIIITILKNISRKTYFLFQYYFYSE